MPEDFSPKAVNDILMSIFHASLDATRWDDVLGGICGQIPGLRAHLAGYDAATHGSPGMAGHGYDDASIQVYQDHYHLLNPWAEAWSRLDPGRFVTAEEILEPQVLRGTEFYNDWLRPQQDLSTGGALVLFRETNRVFMFGGHLEGRERDRGQARFGALTTFLSPFMQHALEVSRMVSALRLETVALRSGVEPRQAAILALGEGGVLVSASDSALAHLPRIARVSPTGRLTLNDLVASDVLTAALAPVSRGRAARAVTFSLAGAPPLVCRLLPVDLDRAPTLLFPGPGAARVVALLVLAEAQAPQSLAQRIAGRSDLTLAEAEVAVLLADGKTPAEIAHARGVSIHTVRNQLKAALGKLGLRRQADLVGLVERSRQD